MWSLSVLVAAILVPVSLIFSSSSSQASIVISGWYLYLYLYLYVWLYLYLCQYLYLHLVPVSSIFFTSIDSDIRLVDDDLDMISRKIYPRSNFLADFVCSVYYDSFIKAVGNINKVGFKVQLERVLASLRIL